MAKIVVTGLGIITAAGNSVEANRQSLMNGKTGIGRASHFKSKFTEILPFAEIPFSTTELSELLGINKAGITRTDLIAFHALRDAIFDAAISNEVLQLSSTALVGGSTVGGMCLTDELYTDANITGSSGSAYLNSYSNSANTIFLQQQFNIGGIINTFNTACSSSANAIMYGARLIKQGHAERAIVGGVDCLSKFTINGFNSLMILSPEPCRPFDNRRRGLNLGEGAAFLVLEKEEAAKGKKIYAEVKGFGNSNDAFHPSATSENGEGPYLSMKRALQSADLLPGDIDFINAHGTATENNDETESIAMVRLFENAPAFASTKCYTGHTLGAAGAVEAVFSILNLYYQEVYPALHFDTAIENTKLSPVLKYKQMSMSHVMSNSFGFGGNCTSLIFSKP